MQAVAGPLRARARWRPPAHRRGFASSLTELIEPYADALLNVPPALHLSYATCIIGVAIGLKLGVSAPLAVWARARTERMQRVAQPELYRYMRARAPVMLAEYKRLRRPPAEYQAAVQREMKRKQKEVFRKHRCGFWSTALVPFSANASVFMSTSVAIQLACRKACPDVDALLAIGDLSDMVASGQGEALLATPEFAALDLGTRATDAHALAAEAFAWCPSLVVPDPTFYIPLAVGIAFLLNVELGAAYRASTLAAPPVMDAAMVKPPAPQPVTGPKRAATPPSGTRRASTVAPAAASRALSREYMFSGAITRALRVATLVIVYFAGTGPAAMSLYWLASHSMNAAQTYVLNQLDRRRDRLRAAGPAK